MALSFGRRKQSSDSPADPRTTPTALAPAGDAAPALATKRAPNTAAAADFIRDEVLTRIEPAMAVRMTKAELAQRVDQLVAEIANEQSLLLNQREQRNLGTEIVDDMIGLGPLETLLRDDQVADILVNGHNSIYVERRGKLELTPLRFRNAMQVMHVAQRIASSVGRRVDESSPMLDARLVDGSRVNVITPPLSLKGTCISIRKFARSALDFASLVKFGSISAEVGRALEICARCRLNIIISGGTGSGKTTLLNALSSQISHDERIVTIEDAAELQLQQPHVIQLETRPPNIEGRGEIHQRDLVRNALRMRPDRIIVGEVRGPEAFDMLQAMNTGHNGSMSTIHANSPRDGLSRIENMVLMANVSLPMRAIRSQMASAVDLIIQIERMRDGVRRIVDISEVSGLEDENITLSSLFSFRYLGENPDGRLRGTFESSGLRPRFLRRLEYYGLGDDFLEAQRKLSQGNE
ncbi:MAG TPA: CpaF family protein [Stellaceae bacterium]|nr:CpaF family protein [Stellaceae bacterium]